VIRERKPEFVIVLGDIGNDHEVVYTLCLSAVTDSIEGLRDACRAAGSKLVILVGNHDYINNSQFLTENHALKAFLLANVTVVSRPVILDNDKFSIVACPYIPPGRFYEALETSLGPCVASDLKTNNSAIIFAHQEFLGAKLGGIVSKVGDVWPETGGAFIFSGHIHERQELQENILYVGTPYQQAFGDGDNKTISEFNFTNQFGLTWTEEKIDLGLPKKKIVDLTVEEAKSFAVPTGMSVRVNLSGTREDILAFQKTEKYAFLDAATRLFTNFVDAYVAKTNQERQSYLDILSEDCQKESVLVREAFDEVTQNENHDQKLQATGVAACDRAA
jgi:DNA repair exonuclease SbcCD nuclease subunit